MGILDVRFVIVFKKDGLQLDEVHKDLNNYGTIINVLEDTLEDGEEIILIFMDASFGKYQRIKLDYNCLEDNYVLWPMKDYYEKRKAMSMMAK